MKRALLLGLGAYTAFVLSASPASAQTDAFMLVPGIPGNSQDARHAHWIEVISVSQSFDSAKRRTACTVAIGKGLDSAGPKLWAAALTATIFNEITIELIRAGGTRQKYYDLKLTNARVTLMTSTPLTFLENLTLVGQSATLSYYPQNPDGSLAPPVTSTVNCS